jgi:hypothetical protein
MCDEQVIDLQNTSQSLTARVPKMKVEEIFPDLKEDLVSILCLCAQKLML